MNDLRYKELLAKYRKLLKIGDVVTINNVRCQLDLTDWHGNSPHIGFLWARKLSSQNANFKPIGDDIAMSDVVIEDAAEIVGVVSIFNGRVFSLEDYKNTIPNIPDLAAVVKLYEMTFPKESLLTKLLKFVKLKK